MHGPSKIVHKCQPLNLGFRPASKRKLSDIAWIIYCPFFVCKPCYTTETLGKELGKYLGKEQRTLCKGFTEKLYLYSHFLGKCQTKSRKSMFVSNHTIVDWGPNGMWLSDCSEDINNTVCDTEGHWHWMEHYYDKGLLEWLDGGLAPPRPRIVLDKQWAWTMGHLETCCEHQSTEQLGTWTGHFIGTSRGHSNYFFHYNQSCFIQACVPLPFVTHRENLLFNKTFMFCNLY